MKENMKLWNEVSTTDPSHTKAAKIGQMSITAICPQYQRKAATEQFGPFGLGWGMEDCEYNFLDFNDGTKLCTFTANLWYKIDGVRGSLPIQSNSKVAFVTNGGKGYLKVDDEYAKKVSTDALTKGLSMLGFNSDVFEGKFDDNKYVNKLKEDKVKAEDKVRKDTNKDKAIMAIRKTYKLEDAKRAEEIARIEEKCKGTDLEADVDIVKEIGFARDLSIREGK